MEKTDALTRRDFLGGLAAVIGAGALAPLVPGCVDSFRPFGDELVADAAGETVWQLTERRFGDIYWVGSRGGRLIVQLGAGGTRGDYEYAVNGVVVTGLDDSSNPQAAEHVTLRRGDRVQWFVR
jgi:hypothetical protein